jgi:hypothetical protein
VLLLGIVIVGFSMSIFGGQGSFLDNLLNRDDRSTNPTLQEEAEAVLRTLASRISGCTPSEELSCKCGSEIKLSNLHEFRLILDTDFAAGSTALYLFPKQFVVAQIGAGSPADHSPIASTLVGIAFSSEIEYSSNLWTPQKARFTYIEGVGDGTVNIYRQDDLGGVLHKVHQAAEKMEFISLSYDEGSGKKSAVAFNKPGNVRPNLNNIKPCSEIQLSAHMFSSFITALERSAADNSEQHVAVDRFDDGALIRVNRTADGIRVEGINFQNQKLGTGCLEADQSPNAPDECKTQGFMREYPGLELRVVASPDFFNTGMDFTQHPCQAADPEINQHVECLPSAADCQHCVYAYEGFDDIFISRREYFDLDWYRTEEEFRLIFKISTITGPEQGVTGEKGTLLRFVANELDNVVILEVVP